MRCRQCVQLGRDPPLQQLGRVARGPCRRPATSPGRRARPGSGSSARSCGLEEPEGLDAAGLAQLVPLDPVLPVQFPARARSQVRYVSNRLSHSRANSRVIFQPGSSPSRARRMNVCTAVMASSIRLAFSLQAGLDVEQQQVAEVARGCGVWPRAARAARRGSGGTGRRSARAAALTQPVVDAPQVFVAARLRRFPGSRR